MRCHGNSCAVASQAVWSTDPLKGERATAHIQAYGSAYALTASVPLGQSCQQPQQTVRLV